MSMSIIKRDFMKFFDKFYTRVGITLVATIFIGISIGMMRSTYLSVDLFTSFIIGVCNTSGIYFRYIYPIINAIILVLIFFLNRTMISMDTVINLSVIGFMADFSSKIILLVLANIIMAFNVSLYANVNLGLSVYNSLFLTINKKNPKISLGFCRIITDGVCIVMGFLEKPI